MAKRRATILTEDQAVEVYGDRLLPANAYLAVQRGVSRAIDAAGTVRMAKLWGLDQTSVSKFASEFDPERLPDVFRALELDDEARDRGGMPWVTAALAEQLGYALFPVDAAGAPADLDAHVMDITAAFSAEVNTWFAAKADGRIDDDERAELSRTGRKLIALVAAFLARLERPEGEA